MGEALVAAALLAVTGLAIAGSWVLPHGGSGGGGGGTRGSPPVLARAADADAPLAALPPLAATAPSPLAGHPFHTPHLFLLVPGGGDSATVTPPLPASTPEFARHPAVLDAFLAGGCLITIAPSYRWVPALRRALLNLTAAFPAGDLAGGEAAAAAPPFGAPARGRWDDTLALDHVAVLRWCRAPLLHVPAVTVRLALDLGGADGSFAATVVVRRAGQPAPPPPGGGQLGTPLPPPLSAPAPPIAACVLTRELSSLTPWAEYMAAIGVGRVYAYLNGPVPAALARVDAAAPPWGGALAALLGLGALQLVQWDVDFLLHGGEPTHGSAQSAAMHSCLLRHRGAHQWVGFLDDDELPFLSGAGAAGGGGGAGGTASAASSPLPLHPGDTLPGLLAELAGEGHQCALLTQTWAAVAAPAPPAPDAPAGLSPATLRSSPATTVLARNASTGWGARTKFFLAGGVAPPVWANHYTPACEWWRCADRGVGGGAGARGPPGFCVPPERGGFLHVVNLRPHVSANAAAWGDLAGPGWAPTDVLARMVGSRGDGGGGDYVGSAGGDGASPAIGGAGAAAVAAA